MILLFVFLFIILFTVRRVNERKEEVSLLMHSADPGTSLYFPATHATHTLPVFPMYPGLHAHSALPLADTLFVWYVRHPDDPVILLYVPVGHV